MCEQLRNEGEHLGELQANRWQETAARSARLPSGLKGIWFKVTGRYQKIRELNEQETAALSTSIRKQDYGRLINAIDTPVKDAMMWAQ